MRSSFASSCFVLVFSLGCSSGSFEVANAVGDSGIVGGDTSSGTDSTHGDALDDVVIPDVVPGEVTVDDTGIGSDVACAALAQSECDKLDSCTPFWVKLIYGDKTTCKQRIYLDCMSWIDAPGVTLTHGEVLACAGAFEAHTCDALEAGEIPPKCVPPPGTLSEGQGCFNGAQCASNSCDAPAGAACGHCTQGTDGSICNTKCAPNLICAPDGRCHATQKNVDDSCDSVSKICAPTMACVSGKCKFKGMVEGTPCDSTTSVAPDCYLAAGLVCASLATATCVSIALTDDGAPCGTSTGTPTQCTGPDVCTSGKCMKASGDGESCGGTNQHCLPGAFCAGGTCQIPNATLCAP